MAEQKVVDFIVNSKRLYPDWLKGHAVFKNIGKIDKVFPRIGLPNFKETCDIMNTAEAKADATTLVSALHTAIAAARNDLYTRLDELLKSKDAGRNEKCAQIQSTINLINTVSYAIGYGDYIALDGGKINLKMRSDIFNGDKTPVFRKDEALLRVFGKLREMLLELNVPFEEIDKR